MQPDMGMMMRMMQQRQQQGQGGGGGPQQGNPAQNLAALANAYPKMKEHSDKMAIQEAERKAKKMKFDMMFKKAEQAFKMRQQQQEMAQQQRDIQSARQSV